MSDPVPRSVSQFLADWRGGDERALKALIPLLYRDLLRLARGHLRRERGNHTLSSAALVNEAYLKLIEQKRMSWNDRAHFLAFAARLMRQILVDHARRRLVGKRQGGLYISLDKAIDLPAAGDWELVALDEGLKALETLAPELSRIVELRFFGGLSIEETGDALGISAGKVKRDWALARAWLQREGRR